MIGKKDFKEINHWKIVSGVSGGRASHQSPANINDKPID